MTPGDDVVDVATNPEAASRGGGPTILFAGGGTGGHISPGLAIAEALAARRPDLGRLFACSDRPIDARMLSDAGEAFFSTPARPFGTRPRALLRFARGWRDTVGKIRTLARTHDIRLVIALGGFVAAPVVAGVKKHDRTIPSVLLNLDAVPGKANRLLARRCDRIISVCPTPGAHGKPGVPRFDAVRIPVPLRRATLASSFGDRAACRRALGLDPARRTLLVTGASQGSQSMNELMALIASTSPQLLEGWQVYHLTGEDREGDLAEVYRRASIPARVDAFQRSMGLAWGAADLVISRAGANSVAEIAANAVPAIFFPYPHHHDRHQYENARPLTDAHGAMTLDDLIDAQRNLAAHKETLEALLQHDDRRAQMRSILEADRPENGADAFVDQIEGLSGTAPPRRGAHRGA